jgi:L-serine dehydratase
MLAHAMGYGVRVVENAAETALEHHLGMTCDPVGGYVQIPCIERNAMGAVKAYAAYCIASDEMPAHHKVGLDQAIAAMRATGLDMNRKYKETAEGGLAVSVVAC